MFLTIYLYIGVLGLINLQSHVSVTSTHNAHMSRCEGNLYSVRDGMYKVLYPSGLRIILQLCHCLHV